jgi:hypothetical protein
MAAAGWRRAAGAAPPHVSPSLRCSDSMSSSLHVPIGTLDAHVRDALTSVLVDERVARPPSKLGRRSGAWRPGSPSSPGSCQAGVEGCTSRARPATGGSSSRSSPLRGGGPFSATRGSARRRRRDPRASAGDAPGVNRTPGPGFRNGSKQGCSSRFGSRPVPHGRMRRQRGISTRSCDRSRRHRPEHAVRVASAVAPALYIIKCAEGERTVFVREHCTMIAAAVQCDVDGIPKGSHCVLLKRPNTASLRPAQPVRCSGSLA